MRRLGLDITNRRAHDARTLPDGRKVPGILDGRLALTWCVARAARVHAGEVATAPFRLVALEKRARCCPVVDL